jgi:ferredoxin
MAYVVCEPCRDCKYTDCVVVCPCDCFYQDEHMLYIDPDHCIDCEACVPECPVEAIHHDSRIPSAWTTFMELNRIRSAELKTTEGPITEKQQALLGAACR